MTNVPHTAPGHWTEPGSAEVSDLITRYAALTRAQLAAGHLTDFEAAFQVAMLGRYDRDHEVLLCVAKDRIRWLSVQLALTRSGRATFSRALTSIAVLDSEGDLNRAIENLHAMRTIACDALIEVFGAPIAQAVDPVTTPDA